MTSQKAERHMNTEAKLDEKAARFGKVVLGLMALEDGPAWDSSYLREAAAEVEALAWLAQGLRDAEGGPTAVSVADRLRSLAKRMRGSADAFDFAARREEGGAK